MVATVFAGANACGSPSLPAAPTPQPPANSLSMRVDGVLWSASRTVMTSTMAGVLIGGSEQLGVPVIVISFQATAPGTYRIDPGFPSPITVFLSPEGPAGPTWAAGLVAGSSGELVLTSVTERNVRGTFSFVLQPVTGAGFSAAAGTRVLTDGMFDVTRFP